MIAPEGALFGSTKAHVELRRKLLAEFDLQAVVSLAAGLFKPYTGVKTSVLVFRKPTAKPKKGKAATERVWFYEIGNDGYDADKVQAGGRPETPERNDIPGLLKAWDEYKTTGLEDPPGVEANTLLDAGSEEPKCWWADIETIEASDFNLSASRYKPRVAAEVSDEDPAELIRDVLKMEQQITDGLQKLLADVEKM